MAGYNRLSRRDQTDFPVICIPIQRDALFDTRQIRFSGRGIQLVSRVREQLGMYRKDQCGSKYGSPCQGTGFS